MISRRNAVRTMMLAGAGALVPSLPATAVPVMEPERLSGPSLIDCHDHDVSVHWVGHSTVLMHLHGTWILTDPVLFDNFGVRVLGLTIGPRRHTAPALRVDEIPRPDIVLLSHAHIDHMDIRTLQAISERFPGQVDVLTAMRTKDVIDDMPWASCNEMDWGDRVTMHGCSLRALRVKHNGWRLPGDPCRANGQPRTGRSFNGYLIERNDVRIVFGGDTAYTQHFNDIAGNIDLAIMPIGAYAHCPETHCTPEESLAMAEMMRARHFLPIHHSTFKLTEEPMDEPIQRLLRARQTIARHMKIVERFVVHPS